MVIRGVGALSCAKVAGLLYLILGFAFGAFVSLFAMSGVLAAQTGAPLSGMLFGPGAIVIFPNCYGIFGSVGALITASPFDLVVPISGGVEVDAA